MREKRMFNDEKSIVELYLTKMEALEIIDNLMSQIYKRDSNHILKTNNNSEYKFIVGHRWGGSNKK